MVTHPLNVEALLAERTSTSKGYPFIAEAATLGHIHLQVTDLHRTEYFYRELLGFEVTQRSFPGALFFAAQQYHHHIGANTWRSRHGSPLTPDTIGLRQFSIAYESTEAKQRSVDALERAGISFRIIGDSVITHDFDNIEIELK
jgi:catechol 2,3-dioxygenase